MKHAAEGAMDLDARVAELLPDWTQGRRADVRIRHLLDHSSGLPAHARLWKIASGRREYERALYTTPLERAPGESAVYSDVGFMLLGFLLEDVGRGSLAEQFRSLWPVDSALAYGTSTLDGHPVAPTEIDPWRGRLLIGEVHDENAAALGGVAGHAGLFGNVEAVGRFAATVLKTFSRPTRLGLPDMMKTFAACSCVPGSSRALAWDTMRPTSSCGTRFSPTAIGHTGFTGTSLWIDPADDLYVVFLTNRVHPTREHNTLAPLRPLVHDAVHDDLEG
jgi:CubicO group peptidase (beta-lactamase class C family)